MLKTIVFLAQCIASTCESLSPYTSNMEMSGYMSDYNCIFANISGHVTAHIFARLCNRICKHLNLLTVNLNAYVIT